MKTSKGRENGLLRSYKCNQPGHRSSDCPRRKTVNVVEHADGTEVVEGETDNASEWYCGPDGVDYDCDYDYEGQNSVVRKLSLRGCEPSAIERKIHSFV